MRITDRSAPFGISPLRLFSIHEGPVDEDGNYRVKKLLYNVDWAPYYARLLQTTPKIVFAAKMSEDFSIALPGTSHPKGTAGEYIVRDDDGVWIETAERFESEYEEI